MELGTALNEVIPTIKNSIIDAFETILIQQNLWDQIFYISKVAVLCLAALVSVVAIRRIAGYINSFLKSRLVVTSRLFKLRENYSIKIEKEDYKGVLYKKQQSIYLDEIIKKAEKTNLYVSHYLIFKDTISAYIACLSPSETIESQLVLFKRKVDLISNSILSHLNSQLERIKFELESGENPNKPEIEMHQSSIELIVNLKESTINNLLGLYKSDEEEYDDAKKDYEKWKSTLGRPPIFHIIGDLFFSTTDRWEFAHNWIKRVFSDSDVGDHSSSSKSWALERISKWLSALNAANYIALIAVIPEVFFSYPAFEAVANGNFSAAISATIVFTLSLYFLGRSTGILISRRKVTSIATGKTDSKINYPFCFLIVFVLALVSFGIYSGATLRSITGQVLVLNEQIKQSSDVISLDNFQNALPTLNDQATNAAEAASSQERSISSDKVPNNCNSEKSERRVFICLRTELVSNAWYASHNTEFFISAFIYAVFFLSATIINLLINDTVFEYGAVLKRYVSLGQRQKAQRGEIASAEAYFDALKADFEKKKVGLKLQGWESDLRSQLKQISSEVTRLERAQKDFRMSRIRRFGNIISIFRRRQAGNISTILNRLEAEIEGVAK